MTHKLYLSHEQTSCMSENSLDFAGAEIKKHLRQVSGISYLINMSTLRSSGSELPLKQVLCLVIYGNDHVTIT